MDFNLSPEQQAYREQVRAWVRENLPRAPKPPRRRPEPPEKVRDRYSTWQRMRADAKLACVMWPEAYGGAGLGPVEHYIVSEEIDTLGVAPTINVVGFGICLPTVLHAGSEAQKRTYLPPAVRGEHVWCQLFSEPGSGSDLASLKTRAEPDGDGWRLSGQKIWTSFAHHADYGLCLARSDPRGEKHKGLSMFIVNMKDPGVTVRPIRFSNGEHDFNEVFLDNVHVPGDHVVGAVHQGWQVAMATLMLERGTSNIHVLFRPWIQRCVTAIRDVLGGEAALPGQGEYRARLARMLTRVRLMELQGLRVLNGAASGGPPGPESSLVKLLWSETNQELAALTLEVLGPVGALLGGDEAVPEDGFFPRNWLRSFGNTLEAGSSEILRNILAERILGLPKDAGRAIAAAPQPPAR
ncbi:MAG TPA: acyl-CoA dehydrogenase family protein [bacterium]|nr:acyl-CoA dehydrogenase family protein [bacterium]